MANDFKIGAGIKLDGEKEFKSAVKSLDDSLYVLGTEAKKLTAQFDANQNSIEALTAANTTYNKRADEQRKKIETITAALESSRKEFGENSTQVRSWQIRLNNAETDLAKTEKVIQTTTQKINEFGRETKQADNNMGNASKGALSFGDVLKANLISDAIVGGIRAIGSAIAAAGRQMADLAKQSMETADEMVKLSAQTGFTTDELQVMKYIGDDLGVSLETQTGAMARLVRGMASAQNGTKANVEAFAELGISVTDTNGQLRDSNDVYREAIGALSGVANETERDAIALTLFGRSAMELNPLIVEGADGLKKLEENARSSGAVMSGETLKALDALGDAVDHFKQTAQAAAGTLLASFAPSLQKVSDTMGGLLAGTATVDEFVTTIKTLATEITTAITQALPAILEVGGEILVALVNGIVAALPDLIPAAVDLMLSLVDAIIVNLPLIVDGAIQLVLGLADGLVKALPQLIPAVVTAIVTIVDNLINNIDLLIDAAIAITIALAEALIEALPILIEKAPEIIIKLVAAIIRAVPKLIDAAAAIIVKLGEGIASMYNRVVEMGTDFVLGIWDGIKQKTQWLWDQVMGFFGNIIDGVKNFLGIRSPSKVFAGIGEQMAAGLGIGFSSEMRGVAQQINGAIPTSFNASVSGGGSVAGQVVNIYSPAALTPSEIARELKNATRRLAWA